MSRFRFFEVLESMKNEPCAICGEADCDVAVTEGFGPVLFIHSKCAETLLDDADQVETTEEDK